eukprot:187394_1
MSIKRDLSFPTVILLNDTDLFDQNEVVLIKRLFEPRSNLYKEILSTQLAHALRTYDILQTMYIIPPFNISSTSNISLSLMERINGLQLVIKEVISEIFMSIYPSPIIFIASACNTHQEQDILTNIHNFIDSELISIYNHPYDVVNSITHQSHEIIITFGPKLYNIAEHAYLISMLEEINGQQTSIIIPNMHESLRTFFSQQSHILLLLNPFDIGFMNKTYLPHFDTDQIKQQLDTITHEDLYFDTKFPKHIIILHSKTQYWHFMKLQKIIHSHPKFNLYGNSFKFSVQFASSIVQINNFIKEIKTQQHIMQINEINHYIQLTYSLSTMSVHDDNQDASSIDWIPILSASDSDSQFTDFTNRMDSAIDTLEQERIIHSPASYDLHPNADAMFIPLISDEDNLQTNQTGNAEDLRELITKCSKRIKSTKEHQLHFEYKTMMSNNGMVFGCVIIVIVIALLVAAICRRLNAKSADLEFASRTTMNATDKGRSDEKILHSISVHKRGDTKWNPNDADSIQSTVGCVL